MDQCNTTSCVLPIIVVMMHEETVPRAKSKCGGPRSRVDPKTKTLPRDEKQKRQWYLASLDAEKKDKYGKPRGP